MPKGIASHFCCETLPAGSLINFFQESILPNFDFFIFPIFTFNLGHFKVQRAFLYATNTQAYQQKNGKKSLFYKEKCLVGLTTGVNFTNILQAYLRKYSCTNKQLNLYCKHKKALHVTFARKSRT